MTYKEWCEEYGAFRWYRANGNSRTYNELDYDWKPIFDAACEQADLAMSTFNIPCDLVEFTNMFLAEVPDAWLRFKTRFEFFTGTLTGETINPGEFHAGRKQTTVREYNDGRNYKNGARTDTRETGREQTSESDSKQRALHYIQGVQALGNINNGDIGELGTDYASQIDDNVANGTSNGNSSENETIVTGEQANEETAQGKETINVESEIVNYYDQLAFARERIEHMDECIPFWREFQYLFQNVESMRPWWRCVAPVEPPFWPEPGIFIV